MRDLQISSKEELIEETKCGCGNCACGKKDS